MTLADVIAELQAIQASQAQFTQADVDAAVKAAVDPLAAQMAALQAQVMAIPDQVHAAVVAEDVLVAAKIKPIVDQLVAALIPQA